MNDTITLDLKEKLLMIYEYAVKNAYRFERIKYYRKDLVHDIILYCLENKDKVEEINHIPSWTYQVMMWRKKNERKRARNRFEIGFDNTSEEYSESTIEEGYAGNQIINVEAKLDTITIFDFIKSDKFKGKQNNKKSVDNTINIFMKYLEGYSPEEISKEFGIKRTSVNTSTNNTRNKIRKEFNY